MRRISLVLLVLYVLLVARLTLTDQAAAVHDAMTTLSGPHRTLVATGGWSRSRALLALRRNRFGEVTRPDVDEAGARGAALLAARAVGASIPLRPQVGVL